MKCGRSHPAFSRESIENVCLLYFCLLSQHKDSFNCISVLELTLGNTGSLLRRAEEPPKRNWKSGCRREVNVTIFGLCNDVFVTQMM